LEQPANQEGVSLENGLNQPEGGFKPNGGAGILGATNEKRVNI